MLESIVFFITALLGFLTSTVMISQYKSNRKVNFYLLVIFFFICFRFLFFGVQSLVLFVVEERFLVLFRSFGCVIFPCMYLYFKCLSENRKMFLTSDLKHFVIPVLFGFINLFLREYIPFLHIWVYFLFSGMVLFYLYISYVLLKRKVWLRCFKVLLVEKEKLLLQNWTIFFFSICVLIVIRLLVTLVLDVYVAGYSNGTSYLWVAAIVICVLFFKILFTSEVLITSYADGVKVERKENFELVFDDFWIWSDTLSIKNNQDLKLKERIENNLEIYIHEIERRALEHFCFRNHSVSMRDFAITLGIPKSHLLYLFKYHSNASFLEFKKAVRIYDAIKLIEEGYLNKKTVVSLSKKSGFASYELFLASFKEVVGVAPLEYDKLVNNL